jgi:hypothetical protein
MKPAGPVRMRSLLESLNEEDLVIARGFHDAETSVRQFVRTLLLDGEADRIVTLVQQLYELPTTWITIFEDLLAAAARGEPPSAGPPK